MTYQANGPAKAPSFTTPSRPLSRRSARSAAALLLMASAGLLAPACAENESSLFIRHCVPRTFQQEQGCTTPDPGDVEFFLGRGRLDVMFQDGFSCDLLLGNQIVERGSSDQVRTETSRISLYSADVRVTDLSGNALTYGDGSEIAFSVPMSGFVDPADDSDPGYGFGQVLMIDSAATRALGQAIAASGQSMDVLAGVIVYGRTLGGQELETPEFSFPITVCLGCACAGSASDCNSSDDSNTSDDLGFCSTNEDIDCRVGTGLQTVDPMTGEPRRDCATRTQLTRDYFNSL